MLFYHNVKKMARISFVPRFLFCRLENENVLLLHPREKRAEKALSSWASHCCLTEWNRRKAARDAGDAAFLKMAVPPKRFFAARKRFGVNDTKKRPRAITSPWSTSAPAPRRGHRLQNFTRARGPAARGEAWRSASTQASLPGALSFRGLWRRHVPVAQWGFGIAPWKIVSPKSVARRKFGIAGLDQWPGPCRSRARLAAE